jgi:hypothetical protein
MFRRLMVVACVLGMLGVLAQAKGKRRESFVERSARECLQSIEVKNSDVRLSKVFGLLPEEIANTNRFPLQVRFGYSNYYIKLEKPLFLCPDVALRISNLPRGNESKKIRLSFELCHLMDENSNEHDLAKAFQTVCNEVSTLLGVESVTVGVVDIDAWEEVRKSFITSAPDCLSRQVCFQLDSSRILITAMEGNWAIRDGKPIRLSRDSISILISLEAPDKEGKGQVKLIELGDDYSEVVIRQMKEIMAAGKQ